MATILQHRAPVDDYPQTADTLARAKRAQQAGREQAGMTGDPIILGALEVARAYDVLASGEVVMMRPVYTEACRKCEFVAVADTDYRAARALAKHLLHAHIWPAMHGNHATTKGA